MQRAVTISHSPLLSCQCSDFSYQPVKRAVSRRDNLCLAGALSAAKPPERLPPGDCFPIGNHQPCSMMIPVGNEQNCLPSVGIATLNRRLKIDDALRATIDAVSCQISVFSCCQLSSSRLATKKDFRAKNSLF